MTAIERLQWKKKQIDSVLQDWDYSQFPENAHRHLTAAYAEVDLQISRLKAVEKKKVIVFTEGISAQPLMMR